MPSSVFKNGADAENLMGIVVFSPTVISKFVKSFTSAILI